MSNTFSRPGLGASHLPPVNSSDNGKVLTVASGEWGVGDAPSGLPSVSAADNGKVLTVAEGEWTVGDGGGAGALPVFLVTFSYDDDADTFVADHTYSEIATAAQAGYVFMICLADEVAGNRYGYGVYSQFGFSGTYYEIASAGGDSYEFVVTKFGISPENVVTREEYYSSINKD